MECCGVNNFTDFKDAALFLEGNREEGINRQVGNGRRYHR
jgi:hypothetical protein